MFQTENLWVLQAGHTLETWWWAFFYFGVHHSWLSNKKWILSQAVPWKVSWNPPSVTKKWDAIRAEHCSAKLEAATTPKCTRLIVSLPHDPARSCRPLGGFGLVSKIGQISMKKMPFFVIILPWMASNGSERCFLLIFSARDDLAKVAWKSAARKRQNPLNPPYFDRLSERASPQCAGRHFRTKLMFQYIGKG